MPTARHYTYTELADRIAEVLGERPSESTLRAAPAAGGRETNSRVRLTAGMPAPLAGRVAGRTVFAAAAVESWLAAHPRSEVRRAQDRLVAAPAHERVAAVRRGRQAGLSWQQIADALGAADGRRYSRQWAQHSYAAD